MNKRYVVAVSGGVDSIVLLDMLSRMDDVELVVAHFDHGIRADSAHDAQFVKELAQKYGHAYESTREELGAGASEEVARTHRYRFLHTVAKKHNAQVVTAHHTDDLVETIAINVIRGTGWRGLAVFNAPVVRPLLLSTKADILKYAHDNNLPWREDSTNSDTTYLRNAVRARAAGLPTDVKREVQALYAEQKVLRQRIETEATRLVGPGPAYSRYLIAHMGDTAALECLWGIFGGALTRPQLVRALHAIKTARPKTTYQAGSGKSITFSTRHFTL